MWTKVYLATAIVFIFVLGFVTYYSASWLGSITAPADAYAGYEYFRGLAWWTLWITSAILLILANIILARAGRGWALWTTLGYFVVFVLVIGFLLPISSIGFLRDKGFAPETSAYLSPFLAVGLCVGFAGLVYVNRLLVTRMRNRIVGAEMPSEEVGSDIVEEDSDNFVDQK
jgi:hypothetical protein